MRALETVYGLGRLAFGTGLLAAPRSLGELLLGDEARHPAVRVALRTYGTRDVLLGLGTLSAVARGRDVGAWLAAGIGADVLDAAIQIGEWSDLPEDKRVAGVATAVAAAGAGVALIVRR